MTYTCMLIDDEPLARRILREYIAQLPGLSVIAECEDALQAQDLLSQNSVDILYLDINMPKLSGIEFIKNVEPLPLVVFTTAYPAYAVEAFEFEAFDYLLKPISFERFIKSFQRIKKQFQSAAGVSPQTWIKIKEGKRLYKLFADEIYWVQAYGDYIKVHTQEKVYVTKEKLIQFLTLLPQHFIQVHRSYLVNLNHVQYLEGNFLMMEGTHVPVSSSYRDRLLKLL